MAIETTKAVKVALQMLVDLRPATEASAAHDYLRSLLKEEDEPSDEEIALALAGIAEVRRGRFVALEEIKRRYLG